MLKVSQGLGYRRRVIEPQEILERCLLALVNEGAKILEEGIAANSHDIDQVWINGYGFPAEIGGPMTWADSQGINAIGARLERLQQVLGEHWRPAALIDQLSIRNKHFGEVAGELA